MPFVQLYNIVAACKQNFGENHFLGSVKLMVCIGFTFYEVSKYERLINFIGMMTVWLTCMIIMYTLVCCTDSTMRTVVWTNFIEPVWATMIQLHNFVKDGLEKREAEKLEAAQREAEQRAAEQRAVEQTVARARLAQAGARARSPAPQRHSARRAARNNA